MRRYAVQLMGLAALGLAMIGCKGGGKKTAATDGYDYQPVDTLATSGDPYGGYGSQTQPTGDYAGYSSSGSRYHTVQKKETLYSIARMYYNGDHTKWKTIYEANRADIGDPNKIRVGQRLIIP
jgi:nucleoid-associated protein YgaU